jgi:hypothetical protein
MAPSRWSSTDLMISERGFSAWARASFVVARPTADRSTPALKAVVMLVFIARLQFVVRVNGPVR